MTHLRILLVIPLFSSYLFWLYYLIKNAPVTENQVKLINTLIEFTRYLYNSNAFLI